VNLWPVFQRYYGMPFEYGKSDCCQFVADCIEAIEPRYGDLAAPFRYGSKREAASILRKHGGLEGLVTLILGEPDEGVPRPGFVALVDKPRVLGIVWRNRIVARTKNDLMDLPVDRGLRFWNLWVR